MGNVCEQRDDISTQYKYLDNQGYNPHPNHHHHHPNHHNKPQPGPSGNSGWGDRSAPWNNQNQGWDKNKNQGWDNNNNNQNQGWSN